MQLRRDLQSSRSGATMGPPNWKAKRRTCGPAATRGTLKKETRGWGDAGTRRWKTRRCGCGSTSWRTRAKRNCLDVLNAQSREETCVFA
jgi:hypothetical protein